MTTRRLVLALGLLAASAVSAAGQSVGSADCTRKLQEEQRASSEKTSSVSGGGWMMTISCPSGISSCNELADKLVRATSGVSKVLCGDARSGKIILTSTN